ncbi:MAG: type III pantothenate kinase [Peptococcaceae bacterium]|nr:type III pantothenate kinase [Peptococcaceae bacterium]
MLLAFDIGNTNIVIGLFDGQELVANWRISSDRLKTVDEYGLLLEQLFQCSNHKRQDVEAMIISSVVPNLTGTIKSMAERYFNLQPIVVSSGIKTGLALRYENPKEVGADRIVNAVAAVARYGAPLIIVDFGTATTFCVINEQKEYLGGAIAPGVNTSANALIERTAQLPKVELTLPKTVIGRNTVNAIQSGLLYGYSGMVDGMVQRIAEELGYPLEKITVVATGGLANTIKEASQTIQVVDPYLTLDGLRILYEKNKDTGK